MAHLDMKLTDNNITEEEREENRQDIIMNEDDLLAGLLEAAEFSENEIKEIQIIRKGKLYFTFRIHPITEEMLNDIRKKYTKYAKNRRQGTRVAEELDTPKYRASMIYNSTVEEDQAKIWDNKKLWKGLERKGKTIVNALDIIEALLLPGEKDRVMDLIDDINGYGSDEVKIDTAKN